MASTFALTLVISTIITGVIWCINRFKIIPKYYKNKFSEQNNILLNKQNLTKFSVFFYCMETVASIFPVLLIVLIIRSFIFEPFQIPSGSMMPTLLIGDFIAVKKFSYGIKNPITQTTLIPIGHPQRGDIAVFNYPKDPKLYYIKRVIGLPGDRISFDINTKKLTISTDCNNNKCKKIISITYSNIEKSSFVQTFNFFNKDKISSKFYLLPIDKSIPSGLRLWRRKETLGNVTHDILLINEIHSLENMYYQQPGQPKCTWIVPEGQYFVMGDNRDNSSDSRYWGFVPEKNFVGKVAAIWMSFKKQEGEWPTGIRLNRIGAIH